MDIQSLIVVAIILFAGSIVSRKVYRLFGRPEGCGTGCNSCPANASVPSPGEFVSLELPADRQSNPPA